MTNGGSRINIKKKRDDGGVEDGEIKSVLQRSEGAAGDKSSRETEKADQEAGLTRFFFRAEKTETAMISIQ